MANDIFFALVDIISCWKVSDFSAGWGVDFIAYSAARGASGSFYCCVHWLADSNAYFRR